jgi:hypothetical protein
MQEGTFVVQQKIIETLDIISQRNYFIQTYISAILWAQSGNDAIECRNYLKRIKTPGYENQYHVKLCSVPMKSWRL